LVAPAPPVAQWQLEGDTSRGRIATPVRAWRSTDRESGAPARVDKQRETMRKIVAMLCLALAPVLALAASPEQEKQFVDAYRKAYEAKDAKALESMLYTRNADPRALEFYKMMMTAEMGAKITSIQLVAVTAQDQAELAKATGPDGKPMKLNLPASKKLVVKSETKDKNGSSSSTSQVYVAEADGKLWVLVPGK
jgi:hypothetical protein